MDIFSQQNGVYIFGPFRLDPVRRTLLRDGVPVKLGARLFGTLLYLVENHGRLVQRDELLQAVWQGRSVEDCNLGQAIFGLRKELQAGKTSENYIVTVAGRGYRFAAPVAFEPEAVSDLDGASPGEPVQVEPSAPITRGFLMGGFRFAGFHPGLGAVIGAGLLFLLWRYFSSGEVAAAFNPPPHSVAVLAFTNMSSDPGEIYFSDGMAEELIDSLSRLNRLRVAARTSAFYFKDKPARVSDIARALNVGTVLEGSVRRDGEHLRITAELVDGATGFELWSRHYDRNRGDAVKVEEEIARTVATSLQVILLDADRAKLTLGGTANSAAFDAYLRGTKLYGQNNEASWHAALAAYDEAVALDPDYALAHAGRAMALKNIAGSGTTSDLSLVHTINKAAEVAADRAVALAPDLGPVHETRADVLDGELEFRLAQAEISRAMELAPGDVDVLGDYGYFEVFHGHPAVAIAAAQHAAAIDPLNFGAWESLANIFYYARRYDDALLTLKHVAALNGALPVADQDLRGSAELMKGDPAAAERTCAGERNFYQHVCLAIAFHALGKLDEAQTQMSKLHASMGNNNAYQYALIYAQWGDAPNALHWLETAFRLRDGGLETLKVEPMLDPVRGSPEFKDIEQRLDFPP
jgi:TolB-like protein/DNA-binding winged helix-turn-helix (wHTH) protein